MYRSLAILIISTILCFIITVIMCAQQGISSQDPITTHITAIKNSLCNAYSLTVFTYFMLVLIIIIYACILTFNIMNAHLKEMSLMLIFAAIGNLIGGILKIIIGCN